MASRRRPAPAHPPTDRVTPLPALDGDRAAPTASSAVRVRDAAGRWHDVAAGHRRRPGETLWVALPSRDDFDDAAAGLDLPVDVVRAAGRHGPGSRAGRPHVEHLAGGGVFMTTPSIRYRAATADVLTGEVACLVLDGVVLTAERADGAVTRAVAARLGAPQAVPDKLSGGVLAALVWTLVSEASEVEIALADAVAALEATVFADPRGTPVDRIYALKREIAEARRGLVLLGAELPELVEDPDDRTAADAWVWRPAAVVERVDRRLEGHDRLLGDMLTAHLALVSVQQNEDVRRISAWAAIAAAPTLIASVYGMNFHDMPELRWPLGYAFALGLMVAVSAALHRLFRRSGWL